MFKRILITVLAVAALITFAAAEQAQTVSRSERYTVKKKDSLADIAWRKYSFSEKQRGAHWTVIYDYNAQKGYINPETQPMVKKGNGYFVRLRIGQKLIVPHYKYRYPSKDEIIAKYTGTPSVSSFAKNTEVQNEVFYFVLPDRFYNGKKSNDNGGIEGDKFVNGFDPTDKGFFHGGDFEGIRQKLDYIQGLGVTSIWMTPVFKNLPVQTDGEGKVSSAYHGYWIVDFTKVDPHFGTNDELKFLIKEAHKRGMKIYFDIIVNHTADVIKYKETHNEDGTFKEGTNVPYRSIEKSKTEPYTPFVPEKFAGIKKPEWLNNTDKYHNQGDSTFAGEDSLNGDFFGLDDLKTEDPEVVSGMVEIFKYWIREFNIDGFRIDTVKHVNIEFWQKWSPQVLDYAHSIGKTNFFMFGEVYDARPSFLSSYTTKGNLPSVLDFGIQGVIRGAFAGNAGTNTLADFFADDDYYSDSDSDAYQLMNFSGNHDMGRFGYFVNTDSPNISEAEKINRIKLAHAFMFFARGIPVIYYGDEQGFNGDGNDKDAREDMMASQVDDYNDNDLFGTDATTAVDNFDTENPIYKAIAGYSAVYKEHKALRTGKQIVRKSSDKPGIFAFSRVDLEEQIDYLIVFNTSSEVKTVTLDAAASEYAPVYRASYNLESDESDKLSVTVDPFDFVIYKSTEKIKPVVVPDITFSNLSEGDAVSGRLEINTEITGKKDTFRFLRASFYLKKGDGDFEYIGDDFTYPYRNFVYLENIEDGTPVKLRVKLEGMDGKFIIKEVSLRADRRVPETIEAVKENFSENEHAYVIFSDGSVSRNYKLDSGKFSFDLPENSTSITIVFNEITNGNLKIQKPIFIEKKNLIKLSKDNKGNLSCSINFDANGNVRGLSSDTLSFTEDEVRFEKDLYLRGSLSGWGATDKMKYIAPNTYRFVKYVKKGNIEFKFADKDWAAINYGAPITKAGLSKGGASGNLKYNITKDGMYEFYFFRYKMNDGSYRQFHLIRPAAGVLGKDIYLRGSMNSWAADEMYRFAMQADGTYELLIDLAEAKKYQFKAADSFWSIGTNFGLSKEGIIEPGKAVELVDNGKNIFFNAEKPGEYKFVLSVNEDKTVNLEIIAVSLREAGEEKKTIDYGPFGAEIYIRGTVVPEGWGKAEKGNQLLYLGDGKFELKAELVKGSYEFKVASNDWTAANIGASGDGTVKLGIEKILTGGSNPGNLKIEIPVDGIYIFKLDASNKENPVLLVVKEEK